MRNSALFASAILILVWSAPAFALHNSEVEVPQDTRVFFVDETKLPFDQLPGQPSDRYWGVDNGAGFRIEVPEAWNGDLVVYTHGFRGTGDELTVDSPPLRSYLPCARLRVVGIQLLGQLLRRTSGSREHQQPGSLLQSQHR